MRAKLIVGIVSAFALAAEASLAQAAPARVVTTGAPAVVNCGAYRHAVVRHVYENGRRMERVTCVSNARHVRAERRVRHRSWKKSALVIGGSTAAGAGAGALVGGKKGALIGAAAGGAAGTAYEVHKRHKLHRHYRRHRR
jgi:hypothetical protein